MMRLAYKRMVIEKFPKILIVHLNRFKNEDGKKVKNNEPIEYERF
jgi:hypothetical protein